MIDIHPPHHGAMTRREVLTHLAIVVAGILIAIGLEQTVEAVHHARQRREVIEDAQTEALRNLPILETDINSGLIIERWDRAVLDSLRKAKPENGVFTITLPQRPDYAVRRSASRAVWTVAHSNEKAALIPEEIAEAFDRNDYAGGMTYKTLEDIFAAESESVAVEARLGVTLHPGATLRISVADRDDLAASVTHSMAANANFLYAAASWQGTADAVAHKVQTREAMTAYITQRRAALAEARLQ
ncbi:MAG TPA: hypothetical protein VN678_08410 [Acidobacteriaceae bacterium]|nr:hypothetical protein [Acidobacteriaceae bacterium]